MSWRWPALMLAGVFGLAVAWGAGFTVFNVRIREPFPPPPDADGIVVLTGGAERIETALHLLAQNKAPVLLVSGVGRGSELADLARRVQVDPAGLGERVTLGRMATSTAGNAAETAAWVRRNRVKSLIVVTASYHMPRALLEMGQALPGVALHPVPVRPPAMRGPPDLGTIRLLAGEYDKWLAVQLGLHRLGTAADGA